MRKVYIIHGWEGYPEEGWFPWLRSKLIENGFQVIIPALPDSDKPTIEKWLTFLKEKVKDPDKDTFFVAHSLGCITTLRYIESLPGSKKIGGAVLIAGFGHDLEYKGYKGELSSFFKTELDWRKVRTQGGKFVSICSDNDPWVPLKHNATFVKELGAESLVLHNMLHFSGGEGFTQLPEALEALLRISGVSEQTR